MRISTAALYTIAAFLAKDITTQAIAATPPELNSTDLPDLPTPHPTPSVSLELVNAIAPPESMPVLPISAKNHVTPEANLPTAVKPLLPEETVELPKPSTPLFPDIAKPDTTDTKPDEPTTASADTKPPSVGTVPVPSVSPSPPPIANVPVLQTLDANDLAELTRSGESSATASSIQVQPLTAEEIAALQQQSDGSALTGQRRLALNTLVAPNLAENAIVAFEEEAAEPDFVNPFDASLLDDSLIDGSLLVQSICEAALNPQQSIPNGICPADVAVANSNSPGANDENAEQTTAGAGTSGLVRQTNPSAYSVYSIRSSSGSARDYYNLSVRPPAQLSNGNANLLFPLSIPAIITSSFGWRTHPVTGAMRFHSGTDIGAPQGTPVLAAFDGRVEVSNFLGGYGLTVVLQHNDGSEQTLYAHLSEIFVQPGDVVKQGEVIGRVGSTGLSTGPHLHFEFRRMTQEGWMVMNPGPALEYALAQMGRSPQIAQSNSLELPSPFRYSGKFLDLLRVASQPQAKPGS